MHKGVKFRIYPNKDQQNLINQTIGCCRLIYNMGLEMRNKAFESGEKVNYSKTSAMLTEIKRSYKNPLVKNLAVRKWECPNCHTKHDRDTNASINILNKGLSIA